MPLLRSRQPRKPDSVAKSEGSLPLEALEFESPSAAIIAKRIPPLSRAINFLVFLLVVTVLAAAGLIQIDKIVSGKGKLVAEAPNIVLQPFDQSIVESIEVRKGDIVHAGQVLARLNPTFTSADLAAMKDQVDAMSATAERLEAEIAGTAYPPDATAPLVEHEASTFGLGTLASDGQSLGAPFRPVMAGFQAEIAGTFALFDPIEQREPLGEERAESPQVLRASEADGSQAGAFFNAAATDAIESELIDLPNSAHPPDALQASLIPLRGGGDTRLSTRGPSRISAAADAEATMDGPIDVPEQANPHVELQASIFNQRAMEYLSTLEHYDQTINQLEQQIAGSEAQARYFGERADLAGQVEDLRQTLVEVEAGTLMNKLVATDTRLNIQGLHAEALSDAAQAGRQMAAQMAERESFIQSWNVQNLRDLAETRRSLVQAEQSYAKARLHSDLIVLTAPRDSVVLSVATVSAGSVVTSAEPLIHLVPMDVPLSVEMDIAGIDSGYVRAGDEVTIKFDTLPYLQYGMARGVVRSISADSFNPEALAQDNGASLPTRPSMLYYKGDIAIDELELHDTPPGFRLMPGMPITADVKVGTRSILSYFVGRILPVVNESIREP